MNVAFSLHTDTHTNIKAISLHVCEFIYGIWMILCILLHTYINSFEHHRSICTYIFDVLSPVFASLYKLLYVFVRISSSLSHVYVYVCIYSCVSVYLCASTKKVSLNLFFFFYSITIFNIFLLTKKNENCFCCCVSKLLL